jgi:two-component system KDP operon response regulator KdpE
MTRILVADDEPQIRKFLRISLGSQGYDILEAQDGQTAIEQTATQSPDLLILDLGLPDRDGQDVLKEIRGFFSGAVIVLSVRRTESEKVTALDNGANDYVTKPFGIQELLARIRGLLKTFSHIETPEPIFDDGALHMDLGLRKIQFHGEEVHLSKKEFELLRALVLNAGRLVTQQQLLRELWGPSHIEDNHYLRIVVAKLRSKLGDDPANPRYLETEPGVGYRFIPSFPDEH